MGIRIHKVMGYGLTNVVCKKEKIVDPRFNPQGYLRSDSERQEEKWTFEKFKKLTLPGKMKKLGKSAARDLRRASDVVLVAAQIAGTTGGMVKKVMSFNVKKGMNKLFKKRLDGFYKARLAAITKKIKG